MADTRRTKRARSDTEDEGDGEGDYVHSEDFWYADGNIVLVAQRTAFRIHQGVLARKSSIFEDMFKMPQPENAETYEDCPIVHVSDTAEDMEQVLAVLYDGDSLLNMPLEEVTPAAISAWLRLGTKYQLDRLRDETIRMLKARYPSTLQAYDALLERSRQYAIKEANHRNWVQEDGDIIALNLARKFGLHTILPAAFLACSQLRIEALILDPSSSSPDDEDLRILSTADLRICLSGREQLFQFQSNRYNFVFVPTISDDCESPGDCKASLKVVRDVILFEESLAAQLEGPFLEEFRWMDTDRFCGACIEFYTDIDDRARGKQWRRLRSVFKLDKK
ncbi:hypothetical protein EIP91_005098 [Steccherinum ochraceum]|uniref:BTB domain-containing protein n=1 Tax=Steccherinum ochraceum TaxID=92696 RepID=A0A4R0RAM7_9APHY|nr:hypothetical protein EIP91_005098 [Steccherinum ochraceum]